METLPNCGGGKRIRTADPLHAMQVLYQLSYTPERENALYRAFKKNASLFQKKFSNTSLQQFPGVEDRTEWAAPRYRLHELLKRPVQSD